MKVRFTPGAEPLLFFVLDRNLYGLQTKKMEVRHYLADTNLPEGECDKIMCEMFNKYDNTTDSMNEIMAKFGGDPIGEVVDPDCISEKGWTILKRMAQDSANRN